MAWWWPFGRNQTQSEQQAPSATPAAVATPAAGSATVNRTATDEARGLPALAAGEGGSLLRTVARPGISTGWTGPALQRDAARFGHGRGFESFAFRLIERHSSASAEPRQSFARSLPTLMSYDTAPIAATMQRTSADAPTPTNRPVPLGEVIAAAEGRGRATNASVDSDMSRLRQIMAMHEAQGTAQAGHRPAPPPAAGAGANEIRRLAPATPGDVPRSTPVPRRRITEGKSLNELPLPAAPLPIAPAESEPVAAAPVAQLPGPLRATAVPREVPNPSVPPSLGTTDNGTVDRETDATAPGAPASISPEDALQRAIQAAERPSGSPGSDEGEDDGGQTVARSPAPGPVPAPSPAANGPSAGGGGRTVDSTPPGSSPRATVEPQTRGDEPNGRAPQSLVLRETSVAQPSSSDAGTRTPGPAARVSSDDSGADERRPDTSATLTSRSISQTPTGSSSASTPPATTPPASTPQASTPPTNGPQTNVSPPAHPPAGSNDPAARTTGDASPANPAIQRAASSPEAEIRRESGPENTLQREAPTIVQPSQPERVESDTSLPLVERHVAEPADASAATDAASGTVQRTAAAPSTAPTTASTTPPTPVAPANQPAATSSPANTPAISNPSTDHEPTDRSHGPTGKHDGEPGGGGWLHIGSRNSHQSYDSRRDDGGPR